MKAAERDQLIRFCARFVRGAQAQMDVMMQIRFPDVPEDMYPQLIYVGRDEEDTDKDAMRAQLDRLLAQWFETGDATSDTRQSAPFRFTEPLPPPTVDDLDKLPRW